MKYPSINQYIEAILNSEGRFRTLKNVKPVINPIEYTINTDRANFRITSSGEEYILSCKLTRGSVDGREEFAIKETSNAGSPYLMKCEYLCEEIYVFDTTGNGKYYDVILTEYPSGIPLYEHLALLASKGNVKATEKFLTEFLHFAGKMINGKKFSHNNLKPKNVFVTGDGGIRLTDYRLLTVPGKSISKSDTEFLSVIALTVYAMVVDPGIFKGHKAEYFSDTGAMKETAAAIYANPSNPALARILQAATNKYKTGEKELAEAFELLLTEERVQTGYEGFTSGKAQSQQYESRGKMCEGLVCVVKEGKYGYADKNGITVIPAIYDWTGDFEEGLAVVKIDNVMGLIDKKGHEVLPVEYEDISWVAENGIVLACRNGKWKFIDREGNAVSRAVFDNVGDFSAGLAWVMKEGRYGFANRHGKVVIPIIYDDVTSFNDEGFACVQLGKHKYVMDTNGEIIRGE